MNTIRFQLTLRFAGALLVTMFALGLAMYVARRGGAAEEVRRTAAAEAGIVLAVIRLAEESGQPVTMMRNPPVGPVLAPNLRVLVEGMPDYVAVVAHDGRLLALSTSAVSRLSTDEVAFLDTVAFNAPSGAGAKLITLGDEAMVLVIRQAAGSKSAVARVAVASPLQPVVQAAARELVGTMVAIAPLLLLCRSRSPTRSPAARCSRWSGSSTSCRRSPTDGRCTGGSRRRRATRSSVSCSR